MEQKPNLDTRPEFIKNNEVSSEELVYNEKKFKYTVLKKELEPKLKGFLGYLNGEHLFISEEVKKEFRFPQLIHEIIEFTELKGKPDRCVNALKRELELVDEKIKEEYLLYRKDFFERLVEYYKDQSFDNSEEFKNEIIKSRNFLNPIK